MHVTVRLLAGLLLAAAAATSEAHPAASLELRGVASFPEAEVRRAIAADLPLLLARRPGIASDTWRRELERAVVLGYRQQGFREAAASITGSVLAVTEGPRTRCGALRLRVPPEIEAILRRALTEPQPPARWDLDTSPKPEPVVWQQGAPLDWTRIDVFATGLRKALRHAGFAASGLTVQVEEPVAGAATLSVSLATTPVRVRLGVVRVAGLLPDEAGRLRQWLALPAGAQADRALRDDVKRRLRSSGAFITSSADWEDQSIDFPGEMLRAMPHNEFQDMLAEDAAVLQVRVQQRGLADLLVTVQRVPGTAMPWEEPSRERQTILAARERLLTSFAAGADLVAETGTPDGGSLRVVWSAAHGLAAIHRPLAGPATLLALADGWLVSDGPAGRLRAPMLAPQFQFTLRSVEEDSSKQAMNMQLPGLAPVPRLQLSLEPKAFIDLVLPPSPDQPARRSWDGEVLVVANEAYGEWRLDPATGIALRRTLDGGDSVRVSLADGVWKRDMAPVIATARQPEQRPLGAVLTQGLTALRAAFPGLDDGWSGHAVLLARSGVLDGLIEVLGGMSNLDTTPSNRFAIPLLKERIPNASTAQLMPAILGAACDGLLSAKLDDGAWPRLLLRSLVVFVCGDQRAAAAGLKPVVSGAGAGPLGCLVIAHVARFAGHQMLAGILAEAGAARCDAAGLELEARLLSGLAPALLPAIAAEAESLAATESDAERVKGLRALAAACTGDGPPAERLAMAVRLASECGGGDWLRQRLLDIAAPRP
jgi:hypothetical protein